MSLGRAGHSQVVCLQPNCPNVSRISASSSISSMSGGGRRRKRRRRGGGKNKSRLKVASAEAAENGTGSTGFDPPWPTPKRDRWSEADVGSGAFLVPPPVNRTNFGRSVIPSLFLTLDGHLFLTLL